MAARPCASATSRPARGPSDDTASAASPTRESSRERAAAGVARVVVVAEVVGVLEGDAERRPEPTERRAGVGGSAPAASRLPRPLPGTAPPVFSRCRSSSVRHVGGGRLAEIAGLAADHARDPGARAPAAGRGQEPPGARGAARPPRRSTRTPGSAGRRPARIAIASPNDLVVGRAAAADVVVVHRRQIVVDQRVAVHQLDRRARQQHPVVEPSPTASAAASASSGRIRLPGASSRVAHRLDEPAGIVAAVGAREPCASRRASSSARRAAIQPSQSRTLGRLHRRVHAFGCLRSNGAVRLPARAGSRPSFGVVEDVGAAAAELHPLLEGAQAVLEREVAPLEAIDQPAQTHEDVVEALGTSRCCRSCCRACCRSCCDRAFDLVRRRHGALSTPIWAKIPRAMAVETPPAGSVQPCPDFRLPAVDGKRYARDDFDGGAGAGRDVHLQPLPLREGGGGSPHPAGARVRAARRAVRGDLLQRRRQLPGRRVRQAGRALARARLRVSLPARRGAGRGAGVRGRLHPGHLRVRPRTGGSRTGVASTTRGRTRAR